MRLGSNRNKIVHQLLLLLVILLFISCFSRTNNEKTTTNQDLHVDNLYEKKLATDTAFFKYKTIIKDICENNKNMMGRALLVRVFTMNCDICFENQLNLIQGYFPHGYFCVVWVITAPNIRAYNLFLRKYELSGECLYVPEGEVFTALDEIRDTYYLTISKGQVLEKPYIPYGNIEGLMNFFDSNFSNDDVETTFYSGTVVR